jgi:hypothetical protein
MLPAETNIKEAYANGMDAEQQFIQDLVICWEIIFFVSQCFSRHFKYSYRVVFIGFKVLSQKVYCLLIWYQVSRQNISVFHWITQNIPLLNFNILFGNLTWPTATSSEINTN